MRTEQLPHKVYRFLRRRPLQDLSGETIIAAWWDLCEPEQPTEPDPKLLAEMARLGLTEIPVGSPDSNQRTDEAIAETAV